MTTQAYWVERFRKQGPSYVAKGGKVEESQRQVAALTPFLRSAVTGRRVLDFGCGPQRFREVLEAGGRREYVGVDLIPGLGTVPLDGGLPRGFDCAVAVFVLQHLVDPANYERWVLELYRSLRRGGKLVVVDHLVRPGMASHMKPRGIEGLMAVAPWEESRIVAEWDGHWLGWVRRSVEDGWDLP